MKSSKSSFAPLLIIIIVLFIISKIFDLIGYILIFLFAILILVGVPCFFVRIKAARKQKRLEDAEKPKEDEPLTPLKISAPPAPSKKEVERKKPDAVVDVKGTLGSANNKESLLPMAQNLYQQFLKYYEDEKFIQTTKQAFKRSMPEQVERHIAIFKDCIEIIDKTHNIETLFARLEIALQKIAILKIVQKQHPTVLKQTPDPLLFCESSSTKIEQKLLESLELQSSKVDELKTDREKLDSWKKYLNDLIDNEMRYSLHLSTSNEDIIYKTQAQIRKLEDLKSTFHSVPIAIDETQNEVSAETEKEAEKFVVSRRRFSEQMDQDIVEMEEVRYEDGTTIITLICPHDEMFEHFYSLSTSIETASDIYQKLALCEESYELLPEFVRVLMEQDGELPPCILCRDVGPSLYMRLGEWEKAANAIKKCVQAGAYDPDEENEILEGVEDYHKVADQLMEFISATPGTLQKDIYKNLKLSGRSREIAIWFCRCSHQIRKEPYGKTNKLYINETPNEVRNSFRPTL